MASGWATICPSAPRSPSSATRDTGWATTNRSFVRRTTFGVTLCPPVMVSAPVKFSWFWTRVILVKGKFAKMLNDPFKGGCHKEEILKWMLQKAAIFLEQQLPLLCDKCVGRKLQLLTAAGSHTFFSFPFQEYFLLFYQRTWVSCEIFKIFTFCSATNLTNSFL